MKKGSLSRDRKVALVTGASRGLGRQIALSLSRNGYTIIVNYLSSKKKAADLVKSMGRDSLAIEADVKDSGQVGAMAEEIMTAFGRLDAVINNAGITKDNLLLKQSESEWEQIMRTNVTGCFHIIKLMSPLMIDSGGGHIVNISSYSGVKGKTGQAAYSASKAALLGLTISAARELAQHHIKVNAVLPGYMMTDMGATASKAMEKARADSIINKLSDTDNVAEFIVYLLKREHITGQVFSLDSRII
jgi:3-oxoacyl-[acyl-carrier protein] reductase